MEQKQFREYSLKVSWVRKINGELQWQPLSLVSVLLPSISQYIKALLENLIRIPLTTEKWVNNFGPVIALCGLRVNKLWFAFQSQNHFSCPWPTIHNRTHSAFLPYTASAIINSWTVSITLQGKLLQKSITFIHHIKFALNLL